MQEMQYTVSECDINGEYSFITLLDIRKYDLVYSHISLGVM